MNAIGPPEPLALAVIASVGLRAPGVFVHPFRLIPYTHSGVFVHPVEEAA